MQPYANSGGDSGVSQYEITADGIIVQFTTGAHYEYTYASAGAHHVSTMRQLAASGQGLNSYIMRNVKKLYARKW